MRTSRRGALIIVAALGLLGQILVAEGPIGFVERSRDPNGDGRLDAGDTEYIQARYDCTAEDGDADCRAADINDDGSVDSLDVVDLRHPRDTRLWLGRETADGTHWHPAEHEGTVDARLGETLYFRFSTPAGIEVVWNGAEEVQRNRFSSIALHRVDGTGRHHVELLVIVREQSVLQRSIVIRSQLNEPAIQSRYGCHVGSGDPSCDEADVNQDGRVDALDVVDLTHPSDTRLWIGRQHRETVHWAPHVPGAALGETLLFRAAAPPGTEVVWTGADGPT